MLIFGPVTAMAPNGLMLANQSNAGKAELRAYYTGTLFVFASLFFRGSITSAFENRKKSLFISIGLFGVFALVRLLCYYVDGPSNDKNAEIMWALEAVGTVFGLILYKLDNNPGKVKPV